MNSSMASGLLLDLEGQARETDESAYARMADESGESQGPSTGKVGRALIVASSIGACGMMALAAAPEGQSVDTLPRLAVATIELSSAEAKAGTGSFACELISLFVLTSIFLYGAVKHGWAGFTYVSKMQGLPAPSFFGLISVMILYGGPLLILGGAATAQPLVVIAGAILDLVWLLLATVLGHALPLKKSEGMEATRHSQAIQGNLSLMGFHIFLIGMQLALITKHTPIVGHFSASCNQMAFAVKEAGLCLAVYIWLKQFVQMGASGFAGVAGYFGIPSPKLMGLGAALTLLFGSLALVAAPLIPQELASTSLNLPALMSVLSAASLIVFMLFATIFGHVFPMRKSDEAAEKGFQMNCIMRNDSIIGGLMFIIVLNAPYLL